MIMDVIHNPSAPGRLPVPWITRGRLIHEEALAFRPIGYVANRVAIGNLGSAPPQAPQLRSHAAGPSVSFIGRLDFLLVLFHSPPCVCG
jgi:hypothetical protein